MLEKKKVKFIKPDGSFTLVDMTIIKNDEEAFEYLELRQKKFMLEFSNIMTSHEEYDPFSFLPTDSSELKLIKMCHKAGMTIIEATDEAVRKMAEGFWKNKTDDNIVLINDKGGWCTADETHIVQWDTDAGVLEGGVYVEAIYTKFLVLENAQNISVALKNLLDARGITNYGYGIITELNSMKMERFTEIFKNLLQRGLTTIIFESQFVNPEQIEKFVALLENEKTRQLNIIILTGKIESVPKSEKHIIETCDYVDLV